MPVLRHPHEGLRGTREPGVVFKYTPARMRISVFGLGHVGRALLRSFHRIKGEPRLVLAADGQGVFMARSGERLDPLKVLGRREARDYDQKSGVEVEALFERARPDIHIELTPTDLETG